ncbi:hypothetical protein J2W28_000994 [Variovorax boronicumulans]|uniref:tail completion protein gp17 n=1 Tax=Variovorax boronicumulans TaxID=436515 RepID=UPI002780365D|nr:DUF3168 domain-containing protein [Variovorax boronicumulans]MDP9991966.1 hypothetical protein [Variovorax boronicumulans]MDQ0001861.1 hypothetical protein [Variovorax boronicumulans]
MKKQDIAAALVTALKPTVSNRVYRNVFPQAPSVPVWPSIRYTFASVAATQDICGDGGEETADYRVQIDLVDLESKGPTSFAALTALVKAALAPLQPIYVWDSEFEEFDLDTKTNRLAMDYLVFPSTPSP